MLLAIDTTTSMASLALYDMAESRLLAEMTWQARRHHTRDLLAAAQQLLTFMDASAADLTALAVTTGPGSYSGVRVGISTVKGIALGLPQEARVIGIPTLTVTAAPWHQVAWSTNPTAVICATVAAGRGRFNWCFFAAEDLLFRPQATDHGAGSSAELAAVLHDHGAENIWLVGESDASLRAAVQHDGRITHMDDIAGLRRAGSLARLATLFFAEGVTESADGLQPLYLRAP